MIKSTIKKEQEKVLSLLIQRYVMMAWSQEQLDATPDKIKDIDTKKLKEDVESKRYNLKGLSDEDKKLVEFEIDCLVKDGNEYNKYLQNLENTNEEAEDRLRSDVFSYKTLSKCQKDIENLLK
jgi:predicted RNase H-like nuclease (RuvC/YqgF family)